MIYINYIKYISIFNKRSGWNKNITGGIFSPESSQAFYLKVKVYNYWYKDGSLLKDPLADTVIQRRHDLTVKKDEMKL